MMKNKCEKKIRFYFTDSKLATEDGQKPVMGKLVLFSVLENLF